MTERTRIEDLETKLKDLEQRIELLERGMTFREKFSKTDAYEGPTDTPTFKRSP